MSHYRTNEEGRKKKLGLVLMLPSRHRELLRYLTELVEKRVEEPKDDLVSRLATEQVKTGNLSKEDAVQMAFLLLVAGNATMVNMIALVSYRFCAKNVGGRGCQLQPVHRALLHCSSILISWPS